MVIWYWRSGLFSPSNLGESATLSQSWFSVTSGVVFHGHAFPSTVLGCLM
jgi:hypothetical protein